MTPISVRQGFSQTTTNAGDDGSMVDGGISVGGSNEKKILRIRMFPNINHHSSYRLGTGDFKSIR